MTLALLLSVVVSAAPTWDHSLPSALKTAASSKTYVLVDFEAPWCYSCYYMEQKVLSRPAFAEAARGLVLAKVDVDTPEGRKLKEKYAVSFLPSYLLLDAGGAVAGRIVGEQTEDVFLARLAELRAGPGADQLDAALLSLRQRVAAGEHELGAKEVARLRPEQRQALEHRPEWRRLNLRLAALRWAKGGRQDGYEAFRSLLTQEPQCETAYDVFNAEKAVDSLYPESRQALLRSEQAALEKLVDGKVLVDKPACADVRSAVEALSGVYEKLDEKQKREALLGRAVEFFEKRAKTGEDRNRDDNLRYFLEASGLDAKLRSLYEELVAAYPADYVYAYRYARYLADKGEAAQALAWAEKADHLAYGANRLQVTKVRAKALAALGRGPEARKLLKRDIAAGRSSFPKDAKALEELLGQLKDS